MEKFWTWDGFYIGVRQNDYLVACDGTIIGKFYDNEIYNYDGMYIGEIQRQNRIVKNKNKEIQRRPIFSRGIRGTVTGRFCDISADPSLSNFAEFAFKE